MISRKNTSSGPLLLIVLALLCVNIFFFYLEYKSKESVLIFAMLDVGQGDALFIQSPTGTQLLVDAGPPRRILGELRRLMSPFDRGLDAIIITNPDQDHIGGFMDVLGAYEVGALLEPGTFNSSRTYENLKREIKKRDIPEILARRGMRLHLGGGAVLDILFPDRDVSDWTTNDGSVVGRLSYGGTSFLLTGDATSETERIVLANDSGASLRSEVLKVGHHGSRTSSSPDFLRAVSPDYALISLGLNNKYGHPHKEVLEALEYVGAEVFRTDLQGTIVIRSDGEKTTFSFDR
jgi:competence protein ComEC